MSAILYIIFFFLQLAFFIILSHIFFLGFFPFKKKSLSSKSNKLNKFAVFIPVIKDLSIALDTIKSLEKQSYPIEYFRIYVIADNCDPANFDPKDHINTKFFNINLDKSSKVESLNYAFNNLKEIPDFIVILDVDNICDTNFLAEINYSINLGFDVIQANRTPKNLDNATARFDALTDYFYNFVDRYKASRLNISPTLPGSGTAISYDLFQKYLSPMKILGGYDKVLYNKLLLDSVKILYNEKALYFDEKTNKAKEFTIQRVRWIGSYFYTFREFTFKQFFTFLKNRKLDNLNAFFVNVRPPLSLLFSVISIFLCINIFLKSIFFIYFWSFSIILFALIISLSLKHYHADKRQYLVLLLSPILIIKQILAIIKIKLSKDSSLPTVHK